MNSTELTIKLRKAGLRPSAQRLAIMEYLKRFHTHPSADEIYRALHPRFPTMSLTTVYNTVHALVDCGLLRRIEIEPTNMRFDPADQHPHGHFRCNRCGQIFDMPLPDSLIRNSMPEGFEIDTLDLNLKGICPGCASNSRNSN